jgi:uncharacterized protein (DUF1330 family)
MTSVMKKILLAVILTGLFFTCPGFAENGKVYLVAEVRILDEEMYSRYTEKVPQIIEKYGGRYIARTSDIKPMAGGWEPDKVVIIGFDSMERLEECFNSPEYTEILPFREKSTESRAIIVKGYEGN